LLIEKQLKAPTAIAEIIRSKRLCQARHFSIQKYTDDTEYLDAWPRYQYRTLSDAKTNSEKSLKDRL
jgi:hypothetical protein